MNASPQSRRDRHPHLACQTDSSLQSSSISPPTRSSTRLSRQAGDRCGAVSFSAIQECPKVPASSTGQLRVHLYREPQAPQWAEAAGNSPSVKANLRNGGYASLSTLERPERRPPHAPNPPRIAACRHLLSSWSRSTLAKELARPF